MNTGPDEHAPDEQAPDPTTTGPGVPAVRPRTVPLVQRSPATPAGADETDDESGVAQRFLAQRRRAGSRAWALLGVAVVVQVAGLLLPGDHRVLEGALVLGPYFALFLTLGLIVPRPPSGFFPRRVPGVSPTTGLDSLAFAAIAAGVLPQQAITVWVTSFDADITASILIPITTIVLGVTLLLGALGLRARRHRCQQRGIGTAGG